ncbi:hypothetical protein EJB05_28841 [Eragrostis curvula]|uniref:Uncharacterized protein n=1 Tax=Eragrostis curvula TaxID=38414 RepID=A0A5J9UR73_9POAL|nr:hypothetical protein EJB05_28841 [Eragrostis curvula]
MHRRPEFSFPGSPVRGPNDRLLPPRPPVNATAPRLREEEEVRWLQASLQASPDYSSGTPSPQLWSSSHHGHEHRQYPASAGSSPSRAQAIAGYRREMLDLVRGLPESAYELSLRDIVEHHDRPPSSSSSAPLPTPPLPPQPPCSSNAGAATRGHEPAVAAAAVADEQQGAKQSSDKSKKQGRKQRGAMRRQRSRSLERSVSLDTGLLIKFFMPLSLAGRGGKKKVSPKPDAAAKDDKKKKKKKQSDKRKEEPRPQEEEEWWSKSEFSEAGSSTRTSSTGSSNSNSSAGSSGVRNGGSNPPKAPVRSRSRKRNGCYAFFRANKSKNGVSQD